MRKVSKVLSDTDVIRLWRDIKGAVLDIARLASENNNENEDPGNNEIQQQQQQQQQRQPPPQRKKHGAARFIDDSSDDDNSDNEAELTVEAAVDAEVRAYRMHKGCAMASPDRRYYCPLEWWKLHHAQFPNVWKLAQRILAIPATSAPSERVFSAAANVVNKKRVQLKPETVDLLIFLRGNKEFVVWD
jgi:hypothetical protein